MTCCVGSVSAFAGGDGTESNPYQITNATELQEMKDYLDSYFILNNDIDCSGVSSWTAIGSEESPYYQGNLNGYKDATNNYVIKNLSWTSNNMYQGIFGCISSGAGIYNCTFDNINHTATDTSYYGTSIICGTTINDVTMKNIILKNSKISSKSYMVGGYISHAQSSQLILENCRCLNSNITSFSDDSSGFISVTSNSDIEFKNCEVNNCIIKAKYGNVGGFISNVDGSSVIFNDKCKCINVILESNSGDVGGFIGSCVNSAIVKISYNSTLGNGCKVNNCFIKSRACNGGFIGENNYYIDSCNIDGCVVSSCTIESTTTSSSSNTGGVIGMGGYNGRTNINNPIVKNCIILGEKDKVSGVVGSW